MHGSADGGCRPWVVLPVQEKYPKMASNRVRQEVPEQSYKQCK